MTQAGPACSSLFRDLSRARLEGTALLLVDDVHAAPLRRGRRFPAPPAARRAGLRDGLEGRIDVPGRELRGPAHGAGSRSVTLTRGPRGVRRGLGQTPISTTLRAMPANSCASTLSAASTCVEPSSKTIWTVSSAGTLLLR